MQQIFNVENDVWERPWNRVKHDDILNRDDRFFAILTKGILGWLTDNIILYNSPVKHYIFNTGSSYIYIESNGYEYNMNVTSGEDMMYMSRPRCIVNIDSIEVDSAELTQMHIRGNYERKSSNGTIKGYNAELRRIPITVSLDLHYVLSNFNESVILVEEFVNKMLFQKYFNITYLGQIIKCSIEFPRNMKINVNKIDMSSAEDNENLIDIQVVVNTNYPAINEKTEIPADKVIAEFRNNDITLYMNKQKSDIEMYTVK